MSGLSHTKDNYGLVAFTNIEGYDIELRHLDRRNFIVFCTWTRVLTVKAHGES